MEDDDWVPVVNRVGDESACRIARAPRTRHGILFM
jgi:hypothetical protein